MRKGGFYVTIEDAGFKIPMSRGKIGLLVHGSRFEPRGATGERKQCNERPPGIYRRPGKITDIEQSVTVGGANARTWKGECRSDSSPSE